MDGSAPGAAVSDAYGSACENSTALSTRAQEQADAQAHGPAAGEARQPAERPLPYDPEEWERRLAVARVRREKVLKQRAEERQRAAADLGLGARAPGAEDRELRPMVSFQDELVGPAAAAARGVPAHSRRAPADGPQAKPDPRRSAGRLRPVIVGLLAGCVAGASLASFGGFGSGIAELRSRFGTPSPFATSSSLEATPSYAARLTPLQSPVRDSPEDSGWVAASASTPLPASAPLAALALPPMPTAPPPALVAPARLGGFPAVFSAPVAPEVFLADLGPKIALTASDTALASASLDSFAPRKLVVSEALLSPPAPGEPMRPPQWEVSRVVIHAPERMAPDRGEWALARLSQREWPVEQATTPYTISETHIRYYHDRDRAAAQDLATLLDAVARDFTSFSPSPEEGLLELWLSGEGAPPQERPVRTREAAPPAIASAPPAPAPDPGIFDRIAGMFSGTSGGESREYAREGSSPTAGGGGAGSAPQPSAPDGRSGASSGGSPQTNTGAGGRTSTGGGSRSSSDDAGGGNAGAPSTAGSSGNQGSGGASGGQAAGGSSGNQGAGSGGQGAGGSSGNPGSEAGRGKSGGHDGSPADNNGGRGISGRATATVGSAAGKAAGAAGKAAGAAGKAAGAAGRATGAVGR